MKKRIVSLILLPCLVLSVLFVFASCGSKTPDATEPATQEDSTTEEIVTTADKWQSIAPQITMIAERDRHLKIECSKYKSSSKTSKNDVYLKGPDSILEGITPEIQVMVYERSKAANDLLGTTTEFVFWNYGWGEQQPQIELVVKGNAADAPDLFVNMIYDLNLELLNAAFMDIKSIKNSFFDFNADGWLTEWMENMSLTGDRAYVLGSDYFLDIMRVMTILPFNMDMMDANAEKLAQAILGEGETLGANEELTTRFFDLVENGNWTWDVLSKLCEAIWQDTDGNGQDSINDVLGILADENQGFSAGGFVYSCGEELIKEYQIEDSTSEYDGKQWIKYADDSTGLNRIFDEVKAAFKGSGTLSTYASPSGNTPEKPGLAYHHTKFAQGETLFCGVCLLGGLEDQTFVDMEDLYSVVPCPKTDSTKTYNTVIYNTGDAGAINVNAGPRKAKVLSAYIQYCTEHSLAIREQLLQIVMKYKVTIYNQGTDRMLNIIYESILYGRDKAIEDMIGTDRWHSLMKINHFAVGSDFIAEKYTALLPSKTSKLNKDLKVWYTLPKIED